jgi:glutamine synthetase
MSATGPSLRLAAMANGDDPAHEARVFLEANPQIGSADLFVVDHGGVARGKRVPATSLAKAFHSGIPMPRSVLALDIWGNDVTEAGYDQETGDGDAVCRPVPGTLRPMTWARTPTAQMMLTMHEPDGRPFPGDPRHVLAGVLARFAALGLTPVVATELEFYLVEPTGGPDGGPVPPRQPATGRRPSDPCVLSLDELEGLEPVFAGIEAAARAQGIPTDTLITEHGPGQFEINLWHQPDALLAADQAVLFKRAVKGCARAHGLVATFMAKPFGDAAGSGMHVHLSLLDAAGRNVFDDGAAGSPVLRHAVAGLCATMRAFTAIFAPSHNSYRRLRPGAFAPTAPTWGHENRTVAVRIPHAGGPARRLEHRVAGADVNPHLALAAILAGVLHGIERKLEPGAPVTGSAYGNGTEQLPASLPAALEAFAGSAQARDYLGAAMVKIFAAAKRQEHERLTGIVPAAEHQAYLRSV